ncbi:Putative pyrophosphorylase ModD [Candidatus Hydrogenisulfobacillus filiaventi]|uniref:Putative pyrophosphorylase ModD n=1 Tax=Candidatus Hydrogenisulfobacillus filiaventi TaxID=2707344 RepID=A0A6F8ZK52_9FIRM|nr:Putative pyrophosphorylase ModD [Candidatus Hydrogenisulfobacillus filiaventi]
MIFTGTELDALLAEDVPATDLTTDLLGVGDGPARITYRARIPLVAAVGVAGGLLERLGARVTAHAAEGARLDPGQVLLAAEGTAAALHAGWRAAGIVLEYAAGIAGATRQLVEAAQAVRPEVAVVATRKAFPGGRKLAWAAVQAGGGRPHRLHLSETVLVFPQHLAFIGGLEGLVARLPALRRQVPGQRLLVEVEDPEAARYLAGRGVDGIQFDKLPPEVLRTLVPELRKRDPGLRLFAAGGIRAANAGAYAATGVDALVTSVMYHAPPADLAVSLEPR